MRQSANDDSVMFRLFFHKEKGKDFWWIIWKITKEREEYLSRIVKKRTFKYVRQAHVQTSLRIRIIWSESNCGKPRMHLFILIYLFGC